MRGKFACAVAIAATCNLASPPAVTAEPAPDQPSRYRLVLVDPGARSEPPPPGYHWIKVRRAKRKMSKHVLGPRPATAGMLAQIRGWHRVKRGWSPHRYYKRRGGVWKRYPKPPAGWPNPGGGCPECAKASVLMESFGLRSWWNPFSWDWGNILGTTWSNLKSCAKGALSGTIGTAGPTVGSNILLSQAGKKLIFIGPYGYAGVAGYGCVAAIVERNTSRTGRTPNDRVPLLLNVEKEAAR